MRIVTVNDCSVSFMVLMNTNLVNEVEGTRNEMLKKTIAEGAQVRQLP